MSDIGELQLAARRIRERATDPFMVAVADVLDLCAEHYWEVLQFPEAGLRVARAYLEEDV